MDEFLKTLVLIAAAIFVINLISNVYPGNKTLKIAVYIITLYVCIRPFERLPTYFEDFVEYIKTTTQDIEEIPYNYEDELKRALEYQEVNNQSDIENYEN